MVHKYGFDTFDNVFRNKLGHDTTKYINAPNSVISCNDNVRIIHEIDNKNNQVAYETIIDKTFVFDQNNLSTSKRKNIDDCNVQPYQAKKVKKEKRNQKRKRKMTASKFTMR